MAITHDIPIAMALGRGRGSGAFGPVPPSSVSSPIGHQRWSPLSSRVQPPTAPREAVSFG